MITSSGLRCDVCGHYILPVVNEEYSAFRCNGIDTELHCHDRECRPILESSLAAKDWTMLPAGPLRKVFEDDAATKEAKHAKV